MSDDIYCNICRRCFGADRYYKAHLKYASNVRCKLANDSRVGASLNPLVAKTILRKRNYDKVDDLLKISFDDTGKMPRIDKDLQQHTNKTLESDATIVDCDNNNSTAHDNDGALAEESDDGQDLGQDTEDDEAHTEEAEVTCNKISDDFSKYEAHARANYLNLTPEDQAGIDLLHMIHKKRVPSSLYKEIYKWHLDNIKATKYVTKQKLISTLEERYNMAECRPIEKKLLLPHSKARIKLICHDFLGQLQSLLTDPRIADEDFLFFDDDPLAPPPEEFIFVGEVNSGLCYRETYKHLIKDPTKQVLVGIEWYMDGAVTGQYDHLPIEALKFTLSIFRANAKDKAYLWRPLGYVTKFTTEETQAKDRIRESGHMDLNYYASSDEESEEESTNNEQNTHDSDNSSADTNTDTNDLEPEEESDDDDNNSVGEANIPTCTLTDLHVMLDAMLESYRETEGKPVKWSLPYKGKVHEVELVFFTMLIKGDTVEHDKHCGRFGVRTGGVEQLCRYCCCAREDTDAAYMKHKPKTQEMIQALVDANNTVGLKALSQHNFSNAWYKIRFGSHNKSAVHGACPAEILHWIQLGQYKYLRGMFFAQTGKDTALAKQINVLAKMMGRLFKRQSDRALPRTSFVKGVKKGKMMAHEMSGLILVLVAVLRCGAGRNLLLTTSRGEQKKYFGTPELIQDWILLLETVLQWEAWLNLREISVYEVRRFKTKVREIMEMEKKIGQRTEGMGFKTFNFHVCLHIGDDILNFGVPNNANTKSNEMHHKDSKSAALKTQRRAKTFDLQTASVMHQTSILELGKLESEGSCKWEYFNTQDPGKDTTNNEVVQSDRMEEQIYLSYSAQNSRYTYKVVSKSKEKHKMFFEQDLQDFLCNVYDALDDDIRSMRIFQKYKRQGQIFRASARKLGKPWRDWVMVDWGVDGILPAQLWCFLDLRKLTRNHVIQGMPISAGIYAIAESASANEDEEEINLSSLFIPYLKERTVNVDGSFGRKFYLVDVNSFYSNACVIPDIGNDDAAAFLRLVPKTEWADQFSAWLRSPHTREFAAE